MLDLLNQNNKGPQANKTTTAEDVLLASQCDTVDKSVKTGIIVVPEVTLRTNVQYKADRRNIINQVLIGAKESVDKSLTMFVGTDIMGTVLRCADGEYKCLDEYTLHKFFQATINIANRPLATNLLTQLLRNINYVFNFREKIDANMEGIQELITPIALHGINISTSQIVLTLMANIDVAAREEFGCDFQPALQNIWEIYK